MPKGKYTFKDKRDKRKLLEVGMKEEKGYKYPMVEKGPKTLSLGNRVKYSSLQRAKQSKESQYNKGMDGDEEGHIVLKS